MNGSTQSAAVLVFIFPFTRSVFSQTGMNHVLRVAPEILTPEVVLRMSVCLPDIYIASQSQSLSARRREARPSVHFLPHSSLSRVCVNLFALLTLELIQTRHLKRAIFLFSKCGLCCKSKPDRETTEHISHADSLFCGMCLCVCMCYPCFFLQVRV